MSIQCKYLGMELSISDLDVENIAYFEYASAHDFRLQQCGECHKLRYPPATRCVWCASSQAEWVPVRGQGTVYSYSEVRHAIQPAFAPYVPYLLLLVSLDTQRGIPTENDALRVVGNLVSPDGRFASKEMVEQVGIGSRVRMVFCDVAPGLSLPQWTADETSAQPAEVWRYPEKLK